MAPPTQAEAGGLRGAPQQRSGITSGDPRTYDGALCATERPERAGKMRIVRQPRRRSFIQRLPAGTAGGIRLVWVRYGKIVVAPSAARRGQRNNGFRIGPGWRRACHGLCD